MLKGIFFVRLQNLDRGLSLIYIIARMSKNPNVIISFHLCEKWKCNFNHSVFVLAYIQLLQCNSKCAYAPIIFSLIIIFMFASVGFSKCSKRELESLRIAREKKSLLKSYIFCSRELVPILLLFSFHKIRSHVFVICEHTEFRKSIHVK